MKYVVTYYTSYKDQKHIMVIKTPLVYHTSILLFVIVLTLYLASVDSQFNFCLLFFVNNGHCNCCQQSIISCNYNKLINYSGLWKWFHVNIDGCVMKLNMFKCMKCKRFIYRAFMNVLCIFKPGARVRPRAPGFLKLLWSMCWYVYVCVCVLCVPAPEGINNQWRDMVI